MTKLSDVKINKDNFLVLKVYNETRPIGLENSLQAGKVEKSAATSSSSSSVAESVVIAAAGATLGANGILLAMGAKFCQEAVEAVSGWFQAANTEKLPVHYLVAEPDVVNNELNSNVVQMLNAIYRAALKYQISKSNRTGGINNPEINDAKYLIAILIGRKAKMAREALTEEAANEHITHLRNFIKALCDYPDFFRTISNDSQYTSLRSTVIEMQKEMYECDLKIGIIPNGLGERLKQVCSKIKLMHTESVAAMESFDKKILALFTSFPQESYDFLTGKADHLQKKNKAGRTILENPLFQKLKALMSASATEPVDLNAIRALDAHTIREFFKAACGKNIEFAPKEIELFREMLLTRAYVLRLNQELEKVKGYFAAYGNLGMAKIVTHFSALVDALQQARQYLKHLEIGFMQVVFEIYNQVDSANYRQRVLTHGYQAIDLTPLVDLSHAALELKQLVAVKDELTCQVVEQAKKDTVKIEHSISLALENDIQLAVELNPAGLQIEPNRNLMESILPLEDEVETNQTLKSNLDIGDFTVVRNRSHDDDDNDDNSESEEISFSSAHSSEDLTVEMARTRQDYVELQRKYNDLLNAQDEQAVEVGSSSSFDHVLQKNKELKSYIKQILKEQDAESAKELAQKNKTIEELVKALLQLRQDLDRTHSEKRKSLQKKDEHIAELVITNVRLREEVENADARVIKEKAALTKKNEYLEKVVIKKLEEDHLARQPKQDDDSVAQYMQKVSETFKLFMKDYRNNIPVKWNFSLLHGKKGRDRANQIEANFDLMIKEVQTCATDSNALLISTFRNRMNTFFSDNKEILQGGFYKHSLNTYLLTFHNHLNSYSMNEYVQANYPLYFVEERLTETCKRGLVKQEFNQMMNPIEFDFTIRDQLKSMFKLRDELPDPLFEAQQHKPPVRAAAAPVDEINSRYKSRRTIYRRNEEVQPASPALS